MVPAISITASTEATKIPPWNVFYAEYDSYGPGANPKARAAFSHQLKDTEGYEIESVLAGTDGWNPIANGNALVNIKR